MNSCNMSCKSGGTSDQAAVISKHIISCLAAFMQPSQSVEAAVAALEVATVLVEGIGYYTRCIIRKAMETNLAAGSSLNSPTEAAANPVGLEHRSNMQSICEHFVLATPSILAWLQQGGQGAEAALAFVATSAIARACRIGQPAEIIQVILGLLKQT